MLYLRMLVIMVVSLYTTRVVLKVLGVEDYGVYNVVAGVVAMFGFINSAMSMATQRFLNVEMGKNDPESLNRTFKMAVNIHSIVAILILVLSETVGIYFVNHVLSIPEGRMVAANWIFQFAMLGACITVIQVPYNSLIYAREQMNIYALFSIIEAVLKLLLVFILSIGHWDKLILYGLLVLCVNALIFLMYLVYSNTHFKESRYSFIWDQSIFHRMAGFMGWNIFGQIAQMLTNQGVNIVINVFHGVLINAAIAVTNHVNSAISSFVHNFQTSFRPQIMKSYAADEIPEMNNLVIKASKMSFYLLYLISVPLMFNIDLALDVWLDEVPAYSGLFCKLLIWYSYIEALGLPLVMSIMATGRNRNYQIAISVVISLNIVLTLLAFKLHFPVASVFYIRIIVSIIGLFIRLFFSHAQAETDLARFFNGSIKPVLFVLLITQPAYYLLHRLYYIDNLWNCLFLTLVLESLVMASIYFIGMTKKERLFVNSSLSKFINNRNKR